MKGWYGERQAHSLASKGIKTRKTVIRGDTGKRISIDSHIEDLRENWFDSYSYVYEVVGSYLADLPADEIIRIYGEPYEHMIDESDYTDEEIKQHILNEMFDDAFYNPHEYEDMMLSEYRDLIEKGEIKVV